MDDKMFELLEKMYIEMQEMKQNMVTKDELGKVEQSMATKDDLADMRQDINQSIVRLENKMDVNHKALYDGYKLTYEKLTTLEKKVDEIDDKVKRQDVEIRVIKSAQ